MSYLPHYPVHPPLRPSRPSLTSFNSCRLSEEGTEGPGALTMCLECLTILCNPDVSLNPGLPLEQRLADDCPGVAEGSALVAALLACLPNLGGEKKGGVGEAKVAGAGR